MNLQDSYNRVAQEYTNHIYGELAHKPFPAGRATQAALTAIIDIKREVQFGIDDVASLTVHVPPLIDLLVGRPFDAGMSAEYARLCMAFVAPQMIEHGVVDPRQFTEQVFASKAARAAADRVQVVLDGNPDPNAMAPQTIELRLNDGRHFTRQIVTPLGSPGNELSRDAQIAKAQFCFEIGGFERPAVAVFDAAERLDRMADAAVLLRTVTE